MPVRRGGAGLPSERDALRWSGEDRALVERLADKICELFPACPPGEANAIAICTAVRGSGRVGRSSAGRSLDDAAVTLAVIEFIRHRYHTAFNHTTYSRTSKETEKIRPVA